ncbi:MAG TPA: phosphoribosylformylglycinamidine synthase subunit PurS [Candidatus Cloacimonadota bacterium]|nr:phosphoribosylformylglycinamidine synthase subunit PurS [Candidatus Cloacimonadota bacterium]HPT70711.1 phosphoribosylformylglycinamidine synthase subunit PurS [Candidatus Cloacimonadota bacterium]
MVKVKIYVTLKPSVLDPQGAAVTGVLHNLGYQNVRETRISKYMEMYLDDADDNTLKTQIETICDKVLANPNTEVYSYEIVRENE